MANGVVGALHISSVCRLRRRSGIGIAHGASEGDMWAVRSLGRQLDAARVWPIDELAMTLLLRHREIPFRIVVLGKQGGGIQIVVLHVRRLMIGHSCLLLTAKVKAAVGRIISHGRSSWRAEHFVVRWIEVLRVTEGGSMRGTIVGVGREGGAIVVPAKAIVKLPRVLGKLGRFVLVREIGLHVHVVGVAVQCWLDAVGGILKVTKLMVGGRIRTNEMLMLGMQRDGICDG